jgi:carboxylesterase
MKSDPVKVMKGAESVFKIRKNRAAVLLLHGFTGNPHEMRYIGEKIYQAGYSISIPRYPGHGTSIHEMIKTDGHDWFTAAREAYIELAAHSERVYIVGLSMGGIFTALLANEFSPEKICMISALRRIKSRSIYLAPLAGLVKKIIYEPGKTSGINMPGALAVHVSYAGTTPVNQGWELHKLVKRAMRILPQIKVPALIIQSSGDKVIPADSADYIYSHIGSSVKKQITFSRSNHVVTVDYDRDDAVEAILDFFSKQ